MKLLINTIPLRFPRTGVWVYTYNVANGLSRIYKDTTFFSGRFTKELGDGSGLRIKEWLKKYPIIWNPLKKLAYSVLSRSSEEYDIYFEPNFIPILKVKRKRTVTAVHDLSFLRKEWTPEHRYIFFRENFPAYLPSSDVLLVPTEFIKEELISEFSVEPSKVKVINYGVDLSIFRVGNAPKENYILFVGSLQPRKNLKRLILAYLSLPEYIKREFKLRIVGMEDWKSSELFEIIDSNRDYIEVMRDVESPQELAELYRRAYLFVFPSLYEGFGFPPLEAMACGCPTVVSNTSSLPEVCGDASVYVEPENIESIAEGIQKSIEDSALREELVRRGLDRVKLFTWDRCVEGISLTFEETL